MSLAMSLAMNLHTATSARAVTIVKPATAIENVIVSMRSTVHHAVHVCLLNKVSPRLFSSKFGAMTCG
jgi:hypothetical protein